jgi:hypothetical protein
MSTKAKAQNPEKNIDFDTKMSRISAEFALNK